jgi:hypothetical protein
MKEGALSQGLQVFSRTGVRQRNGFFSFSLLKECSFVNTLTLGQKDILGIRPLQLHDNKFVLFQPLIFLFFL